MSSVAGGSGRDGETADLVAAAVGELYGADPQEFMDRRKALSAAARDAGDADAARQIGALRKPTRAAWVVNTLTRADPAASDRLASLAASLRAAQQAKDGRTLRELSAERGSLIDALTGEALTAAGVTDAPAGLRDEVSATLTAALADPEVSAALATGTLTRAAQWAGFGLALPEPATDTGATDATASPPAAADRAASQVTRLDEARRRRERQGVAAGDRQPRKAEPGSKRQAKDDRRRQAKEESRLAGEAAQAAARRRQNFEDAEREVASAATAAMDAVAAEDRLEREVRDLEDRLTRTRAQLSDARLRARRAEAAERKARQVLSRQPRPDSP